jgi:Glycosyltransferase
MELKKSAIVYHYIAHYRMPIFTELAMSPNLDVDFISGVSTDQKIKIATADELQKLGVNWVEVKNFWFFRKRLLWQRGIIIKLASNQYKQIVFLGNPYFLSTWISLLICKLLGKKTYLWAHGVTDKLSGLKLLLFKAFWGLSDKIFLYGNYAKQEMEKLGICPEKLIVIYNSLDYRVQKELREQCKESTIYTSYFNNNDPVIIFTGRLTAVKKLDQLIDAHNSLITKGVYCNLVFVGEGDEKEKLMTLAKSKGNESRCWFYGASYREEELSELFYNAKICVAPGNIGLTAMHSMVYGTPVISHSNFSNQMPEFEAIKPGVTGDFFEEDDVEDLADKISIWITKEKSNFDLYRENCYQIIDQFYNPAYQVAIISKALNHE